jgi:hypothetical protein
MLISPPEDLDHHKTVHRSTEKYTTDINHAPPFSPIEATIYKYGIYIQGEHKRTLHFQNDTENKCGVLRTSHVHQSIEAHSKFCFK